MTARVSRMDRITTTIERQWLAEIVAGTKKIEYREMKPYWRKRLEKVCVPFELRLINGMKKRAPKVLVIINRVCPDTAERVYELHIAKVVKYSNWDKRRRKPK